MTSYSRRQWLGGAALATASGYLRAMPLSSIPLGITTDEIDEDLRSAAAFLKAHRLQWAEVRSIWGKYGTDQPVDKVREARAILDESGIRVSILDSAFGKIALPSNDPAGQRTLEDQWTLLARSMERAHILGTDRIRIFAYLLRKGDSQPAQDYSRIYDLLAQAASRAKGFRLAVENIGSGYVWTGKEAADLLHHVKAANLGIVWDPNNAAQSPSGDIPFPDGYRKVDPQRIFHVHLRDYKHQDGKVVWAAVGDGEFDNVGQIRALLKDRYQGTFTLETHWRDPKTKSDPRNATLSTEISLGELLKVIGRV